MRPAVTVAMLVYKDPAWLSFALEGLAWARNKTPYTTLIVGNDAEPDVMATGRVDVDHRNPDPSAHYLGRVYSAWNRAIEESKTELVCLMNSDHYVSDGWLDALVDAKVADWNTIPTSLQVESGRIPSAMPEYVKNFGLTPDAFDREAWRTHADSVREPGRIEPGRLYMPCLLDKDSFESAGGYPIGNPPGTTGDKYLFARLSEARFRHITCHGSVVSHCQEGEMRG